MRIEILLGHLQSKLQTFLFGKGSKTHMSLFQHLRYITFRKNSGGIPDFPFYGNQATS